jgi:LemA protein
VNSFLDWAIPVGTVVLGIGIPVYAIIIYNDLIHYRNNCYKAWANIDVLLKQRHDELPKLIDVCKQYKGYERDLFEELTRLRTAYDATESRDQRAKIENQYNRAFGQFRAVAEAYPEIKANEVYQQLMRRVTELESAIADRREHYNDSVNIYNIQVGLFPELIVAKLFGFKGRRFLKVTLE